MGITSATEIAETLPLVHKTRSQPTLATLVRNGNTTHRAHYRMAIGKKLSAVGAWTPELRACQICRPALPDI
jgi:hypothetical protein